MRRFGKLRENSHLSPFDTDAAISDELDCLWIGRALGFKGAGGKCFGRIILSNGDRSLSDHGTMIVLVVGEMDRAATDFCTIVQHGLMNAVAEEALAAKGRDEARMDVDDAIREVVGNSDPLEEAGHDNQIGACLPTGIQYRVAKRLLRSELLSLDNRRGNARFLGKLQSSCVGVARHDQHDFDAKCTGLNLFDQVFERGAAPGNEHGNTESRMIG